MDVRIENLAVKKLVGHRIRMSLSGNRTAELWQKFMPRRKEIKNNLSNDLFSLQVYEKSSDLNNFNADTVFEKWAAVEVADFDAIPDGMKTFTLAGGLYAVFNYKGLPSAFQETFEYIFNTWLPVSGYSPDDRPHFEILGSNYKNNDPDSEEEIWIPIRSKENAGK